MLLVILLFSPLAAEPSVAQTGAIEIICVDCRDAEQYPDDFVNFAFNQIYGPDAWLSWDQADDMFISNLSHQRVYVDADFVFFGVGVRGFRLPLWPTNFLQFTLALPSGQLFTALRSIFQISLPVPSSTTTVPDEVDDGSTEGSGYEGDEEDEEDDWDDFAAELDDWEDPEDDYEGSTWIEDPDENGDFEDTEWCEEC
jgi:hypothetical protein